MKVEIKNLVKNFKGLHAVDKVSIEFPEGKVSCLMGPSGCGKTSILRSIAGFEKVDGGEVYIDSKLVASEEIFKEPKDRGIGFVFQDFALFPHLNVIENICFGLHLLDKKEQVSRAKKYLDLVGLSSYQNQMPDKLSGGQKQRVAVARALAPEPKVLLLDEAFSSIDSHQRNQLAKDIVVLINKLKLTCIFVTHSQEEAYNMADYIGVLKDGKLQQWDTSYEIYHRPLNPFVAGFVGGGKFIKSRVLETGCLSFGGLEICHQKQKQYSPGDDVYLLMRPDDVIHDDDSSLQALVVDRYFRGAFLEYHLELNTGELLISYAPSHHDHKIGEMIGIRLEVDHVVAFANLDK